MSFTEDYLNAKKKKKKNEENSITVTTSADDYTSSYLKAKQSLEEKKESLKPADYGIKIDDDIAPVKKKEEDDSLLDFFQKGALGEIDLRKRFKDGYQFGDILGTGVDTAKSVSKAILGTAGDIGVGAAKGFLKLGEGAGDAIVYGVANVADALGKDDYAEGARKRAKVGLIDNTFQGADDFLDQYSVLGRTSDAITEGVGQVGGILVTGGLGKALGLGAKGVSLLTSGFMGMSGMGSGITEAYESGATDAEATTYGAIAGAADALTELLFGGLGKAVNAAGLSYGISSLDDVLAKKVSGLLTNQIAKNFAEFGIKAGAEGFEEVLAGVAQGIGKRFTYLKDEVEKGETNLLEILKDENLLEQFVVGSVVSGFAQAPGLHIANKTNTDYITGYSQDEQTVIKKVTEQRIAEAEADGKSLTKKEKASIEAEVEQDMEKGYISTDTIEEVLGGENFTAYQDIVKQDNEALAELAQLYEGEELKRKTEEFLQGSERNKVSQTLSESVFDRVKDTRLAESYRDRARRREKFTADVSQYDEKQKVTIQRAIESGVLNNTNRTHDMVDFIAKVSADTGVLFDFTNNQKLRDSIFAVDGKTVDGYITENGITINVNSKKYINTVVGHEITHALEGSKLYEALEGAVFEYAKSNGTYKDVLKATYDMYHGQDGYQGYEGLKKIKKEAVANLVGDYLFTDKDFVSHLSSKHQNIFQKVWNEIKYMVKIARAGSNEAKKLLQVQKAFEDAYRGGGQTTEISDGNARFSLENGNKSKYNKRSKYNEAETLFLRWENGSAPVGEVRKFNRFGKPHYYEKTENGVVELSRSQYIERNGAYAENIDRRAERRFSNTLNNDESTQRGSLGDHNSHRDSGGTAAVFGHTIREKLPDAAQGSVRGVPGYDSGIDTGNGINQSEYAEEASDDSGASFITFSNDYAAIRNFMKDGDQEAKSDSDTRYSLSAEQEEYFRDSVVRDENGNLKVMYHGTPNGDFTIFKDGTYFTDNKAYADRYQNPGASSIRTGKVASSPKTFEVYLNIKKPFDINDAEARRIYIEDYIKGGNAMGINPYLSDAEYAKIKAIDWTEGEDLREFLIDNGYDYDGLVLDEGADGGYGDDVKSRGTSWVVFSPEQVKSVDNKKPSSDPDIRFSLSESGEGTQDINSMSYAQISEEQQRLFQRERFLADRKREVSNSPELLQAMDDVSSMFTEVRGLLAKKRNGTATQAELDRIEELKTLREERIKQVADLQESLGLNAIAKEEAEIREAKETLRVASDKAWAREGAEKENIAIEKSGLPAPEYFRKKALKAFKTTTNFNEAGYMLPDGKLLNFSGGERNHRYRDHREIGEIYEATQGVHALNRFLRDGNIRIMAESPGIDIAAGVEPTREQYVALRKFINTNGVHDGQFFVDFSDADGRSVGKYAYQGRIFADRILNDIKYFYQTGSVRESSGLTDFLSLSANDAQPAGYGNWRISGEDVAYEDIAPAAQTVSETESVAPEVSKMETTTEELFPDDLAPMIEDEADAHDRLWSIDEADAPPETVEEGYEVADVSSLNKTTVDNITRQVKAILGLGNRDMADVRSIIEGYSTSEFQSSEQLFYDLKERFGKYTEKSVDEDAREVKALLRAYPINVTDDIKGSIADYGKVMRSNFGKVRFPNAGLPVDVAYADLSEQYPGYFPESITNPTDQLLRIMEVANMDIQMEAEFDIDDADIEAATLAIARGVNAYKRRQNQAVSNRQARDAFNALMESPDQYVPPVPENVAPVRNTKKVQSNPEDIAPIFETSTGQQAFMPEAEVSAKLTRKELHSNIMANIRARMAEKGIDLDTILRNAKNLSPFATVDNTPQRVNEKTFGYKAGQALNDVTVDQVARNETEGIKWLNTITDRKKGLLAQLSKQYGIKPGSKASAAAQMYAEGYYVTGTDNDGNYVEGKSEIVQYGDRELALDFPDAKVRENIKGLARDPRIRKFYDETLTAINESRTRNAYPEIPRLDNYFLHFRAMEDTFSRLGLPFNPNDIRAKDLPTDLNGVTADLKPGQPYFASAMHRTGKRTSHDILGGLERYATSAKNQIYHIDDIQVFRALRNYLADTFGQAHGLEGLDAMTEEEAQERIAEVYNSHLSNYARFLNEEANFIAGKTPLIDRGIEGILGRRGMTFLDTVNRQVGSNMVGFNVSSSLTNFLSVAQAFAKTNKYDFMKGFAQTVSDKVGSIFGRSDGFMESSPVAIRRKGAERFHRTPWQKAGDAGYVLMSAVDNISTEIIARAKYNELTRKGMDSQQAHMETDKWVSRLMGDRSLGQQPHLYNSKMLGIVTKFQLEVRNQLDSQFYDTIQEAKASNEDIQNGLARNAKTAAKVTSTLFQLAVAQHLFGKAFESIAGYNPAFDIISVIIKAFGWDDEEESEDTALDNLEQGFLELLGDLPYTSTFTGGRIPISSALPIEQFVTGKDQYGNEKSRWETLAEAAPYYILPGGYNQAKKTVQGLGMFDEDLPIAGSYTDSGNLRFPVEDTFGNRLQAGIFGQWASENARDYFDNKRSPLKPNQIQEFIDVDIPISDYWKYREGLSGLTTLEQKADYIAGLDLPVSKKNILINNIADRKDPIDMTDYMKYSSFEEFDYAQKNPEKYAFLQEIGVSYSRYKALDEKDRNAYEWAFENPEGYLVSRAVTSDVVEYRRYTSALNELKADKDENGKSISGSRKEKVIDYINSLDADYGAKIILFKSEYPSDDSYNYDILDYLNSREDLSFEEIAGILKKLGFTVDSEGNVFW